MSNITPFVTVLRDGRLAILATDKVFDAVQTSDILEDSNKLTTFLHVGLRRKSSFYYNSWANKFKDWVWYDSRNGDDVETYNHSAGGAKFGGLEPNVGIQLLRYLSVYRVG